MSATRIGATIAGLLLGWALGGVYGAFAQVPDVDLTVDEASLVGDGLVVQGNGRFTADLKDTHRNEIGLRIAAPACASGESMLTYSISAASAGKRTSTQKIMHRVTQDRNFMAEFGDEISVSFDVVFPKARDLPAPEEKKVIFLQIWQGAPYPPPLALSVVGGDEQHVEVELSTNVIDYVRRRNVLAELTLPREACIRFELTARPTLPGEDDGRVDLSAVSSAVSGTEQLYENAWTVNFGFDPENPRNFFAKRCQRRSGPCCSEDGICQPNRRFQVLFGLYRPTQDVPAQISIGDFRYRLSR